MRVRLLLAAVCLAGFAQFAVAAVPQVTFAAPAYKVTVTPGATIAYLYAISPGLYASGALTDSDSDGSITIDVGLSALPSGRGLVVVDVATGEYAIESYSSAGHNPGTILKGPTGAFTEIMLARSGRWCCGCGRAWGCGVRRPASSRTWTARTRTC